MDGREGGHGQLFTYSQKSGKAEVWGREAELSVFPGEP